nr:MAG TPA: hypothetical protein [Caudoviricetes sp.]
MKFIVISILRISQFDTNTKFCHFLSLRAV